MKVCPICNQTYKDENLNFCLNDGGVLALQEDISPPTVILNQARKTNPNWTDYQPPTYENQQLTHNQPWGLQGQNQFPKRGQDQTLPTISLVLGILGLVLFCCWGGIPFGLIAIVLGYLGVQNANNNPSEYGGKGLAIAGIITGIVGFIFSTLYFILTVLVR